MELSTAQEQLNFAEINTSRLRGLDSQSAFKEFSERYTDIQAALLYFLDHAHMDEAFRLTVTLGPFWMGTKRLEEGLTWLKKVIAVPGGTDLHRGRAYFDTGYLAFWKGDYEYSSALYAEALRLGRQANSPTVIAMALTGFARIALQSDLAEARKLCIDALAITDGTTDQLGRSNATHVLGVVAQMTGNFEEARDLMKRRIAFAQEAGNYAIISSEAGNLSMVERQLGNLDEAEALARQALEIDQQRGDAIAIPWKVNGFIAVAADRGQYERAALLVGIADATMKASGGYWPPDELIHYEHAISILNKELGASQFEELRIQGNRMPFAEAMDFALSISPAIPIS